MMKRMKEQDKIRVTLESMGSGLIATDIKGSITFMNPTAEAVTGFTKQEAVGKHVENIFRIPEDEYSKTIMDIRSFIKTMSTEVVTARTYIITKNNTKKYVSGSLTSITNDFNEFIGVVLVFEDITAYAEAAAAREDSMEAALRRAIENEELVLHYQPKVDSKTGELSGMEALVRWHHPEKGLIYPSDFIPLAEETGLIQALDEWVLRKACSQLKKWKDQGYKNLRLSVNLSAWQFRYRHLPDTVAAILKETGIDPSCLELEITETVAVDNMNSAVDILNALTELGVCISIDDFGSGYSSLRYLNSFSINYLKIDKSFIADIPENKNTFAIVKAIIEIAHNLKLKVIAEGVETKEQLAALQRLGCDEIQGFYISKPLTAHEAEALLNSPGV